ncbi:MAG: hypothetical protein ACFFDT_09975 [Candidatus Hodarchaeota archaeon]
MYSEMKAQLELIKNRFDELQQSYNSDLKKEAISNLTLTLPQEILVLMRRYLDQAMYTFFTVKIFPNLTQTEKEKLKYKIYFPIEESKAKLESKLERNKLKESKDLGLLNETLEYGHTSLRVHLLKMANLVVRDYEHGYLDDFQRQYTPLCLVQ